MFIWIPMRVMLYKSSRLNNSTTDHAEYWCGSLWSSLALKIFLTFQCWSLMRGNQSVDRWTPPTYRSESIKWRTWRYIICSIQCIYRSIHPSAQAGSTMKPGNAEVNKNPKQTLGGRDSMVKVQSQQQTNMSHRTDRSKTHSDLSQKWQGESMTVQRIIGIFVSFPTPPTRYLYYFIR